MNFFEDFVMEFSNINIHLTWYNSACYYVHICYNRPGSYFLLSAPAIGGLRLLFISQGGDRGIWIAVVMGSVVLVISFG
jgi:hypothetical protein